MRKLMKVMSLVFVLAMVVGSMAFAADGLVGASAAEQDTSYTLEDMLAYALQDEKLAQAEYEAIINTFDVTRPFSNIAKAEVTHENAILSLYEAKGLEVPEFDASTYVVLPESLEEVFQIGVDAEIANIAMYDTFLEQDLDEDVAAVFQALRDASENHLAAFQRGVEGTLNSGLGYGRQGNTRGVGNMTFGQGNGYGNHHANGLGQANGNGLGTGQCQSECLLNQ